MASKALNVPKVNSSTEGKMLAMIEAIVCTFYFIIFISETVTENATASCFQKESNKRIRQSKAAAEETITRFSNSEKIRGTEGNSTDIESPKTDSMQSIIKSSNLEYVKQEKENFTVKESLITMQTLNSELMKKEEGNPTEKELSITINSLNSKNTKKEEGNSKEKTPYIKDTSVPEKLKGNEGNSIEKESSIIVNSLNTQDKNKVNIPTGKELPIIKNLSNFEKIRKEEASTEKKLLKVNLPENTKIEVGISTEMGLGKTNPKDFAQKSSIENSQLKLKVRRQIDDDSDRGKNGRAFLTAFKNCKLMKGNHYIRVQGQDSEESKKCVTEELKNLETYEGEYTKLLDNLGILIRN